MNKLISLGSMVIIFCVMVFVLISYDLHESSNIDEYYNKNITATSKSAVIEDLNDETFVKNEDQFHYFSFQKEELPYRISMLDEKYDFGIGHIWFGYNHDLKNEHHSNEHQKGYVVFLTPIINDLMYSRNIEYDQDKLIDYEIVNEIHNPIFEETKGIPDKQHDWKSASVDISIIKDNEIDFCFESITKVGDITTSPDTIYLEIDKDDLILSKEYIKDFSLFELIESDKCHSRFGGKFFENIS